MNVAYIISAYKLPELLVRLVRRLDAPGTSTFIHVDARTHDGIYNAMAAPLARLPHVRFLPRHPCEYADLLGERIREHGAQVWLVNTGWSGGGYDVGSRMRLAHTRAMVNAALAGDLDDVEYSVDPVFGVEVPTEVPGVPSEVLQPRGTWADADAYDAAAEKLARMFKENFKKFADRVSEQVQAAGPA